ncbi:hypothetical protein HPB52_016052 [Rhipicephalus sanguineus]|uniref:Uncharacterized protein n=1 Tax=Rhipicephalus sanguineus TaxID=34632 RepID=A0A9D4SX71_RHISA|nr:hypothetical protein HPB52_016052 [Rhipicephalus sanguineus]
MLEMVLKALKEIKAELGAQTKGIQRLESAIDLQQRTSAGPSLDSSMLDLLPLTTQSSLGSLSAYSKMTLTEQDWNAIVTPMTKEKSATTNSTYSSGLCDADRERYAQKLELCGFDPFELDAREWLVSADVWPRVNMCDIHDFLVVRTSFLTRK